MNSNSMMCNLVGLFILVFLVVKSLSLHGKINPNDPIFQQLPPIFHIDDYDSCKANKGLFCKVSVILEPQSDTSNISVFWTIIAETITDGRFYNHNELFHAICLPYFCDHLDITQEYGDIVFERQLSECYTFKYKHLGLSGNVVNFNCRNYDNAYKATLVDFVVLTAFLAYAILVISATWRDYQIRHESKEKQFSTKRFDFLAMFSIISNWEKLNKQNEKFDFQQLNFVQGIRFYNMLLIIFCHTVSSYIGGYVANTSYFETIETNAIRLAIRTLLVFLVQTFFLFSAFLLSYHIFQIMETEKAFKFRHILLSFVNRYLRILPPVVVMISLGSTMWIVFFFYGPIKDLYSDFEYKMCRKNWWTTLLFINNHYNQYDMCYFITWYLAADTQLYVLSLIVLSIIWKFPHKTILILCCFVCLGIIIPSVISHVYNLDIIYRLTPENTKNNKFRSFTFNAIYSSTYANMATYMVGICVGYIYFKYRKKGSFHKPVFRYTWSAFFIGLPMAVIMTSCYEYSRWISTILCGILKPLYAIGIGMGVLGMSQKFGGVARRICEWKVATFLGNFTYSTYVVHYGIVFYRTAVAKQPLIVSDFVLVTSFVHDAILSFLCGLFMHILIEMPALHLQHRFVPKIRKTNVSQ